MNNTARSQAMPPDANPEPKLRVVAPDGAPSTLIPSGVQRLDERLGGLDPGGVYLVAGTPGPAKLVTALQFLHAGVARGETVVLLTSAEGPGILDVARAWGLNLDPAWEEGRFRLLGFKDDFELRVLRSAEPQDVLEELDGLISDDTARIAVDPGAMFLQGGAKTLLGKSFLDWGRRHPATFLATLSVDSPESLPSSAEWLVHATHGVFQIDRRPDGLYQLRINRALIGSVGEGDPITLQLTPGRGLVDPERFPTRRRADRPAGEAERLLLVSLAGALAADFETWAKESFKTHIVKEPLEAVTLLQDGASFGGVLVHAPRTRIREAVHACRALRPLTAAAVVFTSDDSLRSTDRVSLLEAGADDCLTGVVDFRELEARLSQAVSAGGKPPPALGTARRVHLLPLGGAVTGEVFRREISERCKDGRFSVFTLVRLVSDGIAAEDLEATLAQEVRADEGDLFTPVDGGSLILLQGARRKPAQSFVARFLSELEGKTGLTGGVEFDLLSHPAEVDQLEGMLEGLDDAGDGIPKPGVVGGRDAAEA
jgi:CheY-like chemotaxis protein